ncbi:MAG: hypothetical protein ACMUIU_03180 [bacterium]
MFGKCSPKTGLQIITAVVFAVSFLAVGCDSENAVKKHHKAMSTFTESEYQIPKVPVDRHYIGYAWSKQFGPVKDPLTNEIKIKKERSFNKVQQDFAYNVGIGLGAQSITGPGGETEFQRAATDRSKLEGVEVIKPVSLPDIPFEPEVPYIIEALRLKGFTIKSDTATDLGLNISASKPLMGKGRGSAGVGAESHTETEGEGLVVAYKLSKIDMLSYDKKESDILPLEIEKPLDFHEAGVVVRASLSIIEPGSNETHPTDILWPCERAQANNFDIVAVWIVDVVPIDLRKKRLSIGFPAYPEIEDCNYFSGLIFSRIDPVTDKIHRQKITITVEDAEVSDTLQPKTWNARVSLISESFNISLVLAKEMEED